MKPLPPQASGRFRGPYAIVTLDPAGELQVDRHQLASKEAWQHVLRIVQRKLRRRIVQKAWMVDLNNCTFSPPQFRHLPEVTDGE